MVAQVTGTAINPASLRVTLTQLGIWGPLVLIGVLAAVLIVPIVPASVFQVGAGLAFGPWLGLVYALVADGLGASVGFWLARRWGKPLLGHYLSPETQSGLERLTKRITGRGVIILRLIPGPAYPLVSFAAGYSPISYLRYILSSFIGVLPGLILLVLAGDIAESSPLIALGLVVLLIVGLLVLGRFIDGRAREGMDKPV